MRTDRSADASSAPRRYDFAKHSRRKLDFGRALCNDENQRHPSAERFVKHIVMVLLSGEKSMLFLALSLAMVASLSTATVIAMHNEASKQRARAFARKPKILG
jgi:hypothetical protein